MTQITYTLLHPGSGDGSPDDKVFVCCPACGVRIFRVSSCSNAEHLCPKCGIHLSVDVEGDNATVDVCRANTEFAKATQKGRRKKPIGNMPA